MERSEGGIDLGASVGYRLKEASSALHAAMEDVLRPLGLNITQYSTLELLAQRPGLSSSDLARGTFVTRQSMSIVLQGLAATGLVSRADAATVGRVLPVELTDVGAERLRVASAAVRKVEQRMLAGVGSDETALLRRLLDRCTAALRAPDAADGRPVG